MHTDATKKVLKSQKMQCWDQHKIDIKKAMTATLINTTENFQRTLQTWTKEAKNKSGQLGSTTWKTFDAGFRQKRDLKKNKMESTFPNGLLV